MASDSSQRKLSFEELKELNARLDRQLKSGDFSAGSSASPRSRSEKASPAGKAAGRKTFRFRRLVGRSLLFLAAMVLPFLVLVRTSTWVYRDYDVNGWLALGAGVAGTVLLLLCYLLYASIRFRRARLRHRYVVRGVILLVVAYCGYALIYISSMNTKTDSVRSYYRSLHPVMRVAVTTASLADDDLVVTDIGRTTEDYRAMGLTPLRESHHYLQENGYVHAVDLRTLGRAEWKNLALTWLFRGLGFETLRHTGTADHLHVYLPLNDS